MSLADFEGLQPGGNFNFREGAGIKQTVFIPSAGTLSFEWNIFPAGALLGSEPRIAELEPEPPGPVIGDGGDWYQKTQDTAFFSLNGELTKITDMAEFRESYPNLEDIHPEIPWQTTFITIDEPGEYVFGVGFLETMEYGMEADIMENYFYTDNFQFTPIPEPGTVAAGALFLGLLGFAAWRRRRASVAKAA